MTLRNTLLFSLFLLAATAANAQRAITFTDLPLDTLRVTASRATDSTYAESVSAEALKTGASVTWDFSDAPTSGQTVLDTVRYLDPAETPYADEFQDATHAEWSSSDSSYSYYIANEQRYESLGRGQDDTTARNTNFVLMTFPFNFEQELNNEVSSITSTMGEAIDSSTGQSNTKYAGYGQVKLPQGTVSDVVQLKLENVIDQGGAHVEINTRLFFNLETKQDVAVYTETLVIYVSGEDTLLKRFTRNFSYDPTAGTSRKSALTPALLSLHPNPTTGDVNLGFFQREAGQATVEVSDLLGRVIYRQTLESGVGPQQTRFKLEAPAGAYLVRVSTPSGATTQKLILN